MAVDTTSRSPGSRVLEIIILLLLAVLLLAILVPKRQWGIQTDEEALCRQRMENIHFAVKFYRQKGGLYSTDLDKIMTFAERESIDVYPPGFKLDRLTRSETGIDSFQVEYYDPYQLFSHYEKAVDIQFPAGKDSVVLTITPRKEYPFVPITRYTFAADVPITAVIDDRGDQGTFALVGAQGKLRGLQIIGEMVRVPAAEYIYNIDHTEINQCPTTQTVYQLWVNVKLTIEAEMRAVLEKKAPETSLATSSQLASIVVFRMLKEADAAAKRKLMQDKTFEAVEDSMINARNQTYLDSVSNVLKSKGLTKLASAIYDSTLDYKLEHDSLETTWETIREASYQFMNGLKEDTTFQAIRDNLVNSQKEKLVEENFNARVDQIRKEKSLDVVEVGFINTTSDSIGYYSDTGLIKERLFKAREDSITTAHLTSQVMKDLLSMFSFTESYRVNKVDSTGTTIKCPIEGEYSKQDLSWLDNFFRVRGAGNHGVIDKDDLSWSEKR